MRKKVCLFLTIGIILATSMTAYAFNWKFWQKKEANAAEISVATVADFEILPTMDSVSNAKNQVWVGTFQLIWNDLINELVKHPIEFVGYKSVMAYNLNKQAFTTVDISDSAYYKKWGLASPQLKQEIEDGIKEKFNEKSDILDAFDWTPGYGKYFLYAMLKKDFQYLHPFDKLEEDSFNGSNGKVKYFGIDDDSSESLRYNIDVLFYNNNNDFAVSIKSKTDDIVYLYRTNDDKTLDILYNDMKNKSQSYTGKKKMSSKDRFKAPNIDFKEEREFPEICEKVIKDSDFMITKAIETVQFKMDETGVRLKSEAGMMVEKLMIIEREQPRYFNFNDRYVIFLEESGKKPYFAMKIQDAKKLQK